LTGSIRDARRAGAYHAIAAVTVSSAATAM
jgi:hypothetical protein